MGRARELLKLVKVRFTERSVAFVWSTVIGLLVASAGVFDPLKLLYAFLTSFLVGTAVYVYNDVMDYEFDKISKVNRPIATDNVTREEGLIVVLMLLLPGFLLSALINIETLLLSIAFFTLGFLYSTPPIRLKDRFLSKQLITATGGFICSLIGGSIVQTISIQVVYLGFIFFMILFSGSPLFDLPDLKGDRAGKVKSITVLYGPRFAIKFAIAGFSSLIVITALVYQYLGFNVLMPITLSFGTLLFIWFAYGLLNNWQNISYCRKTIKKYIIVNFLLQFSFILGVLPIV